MRILMEPVEMVAWSNRAGKIRPVRYRLFQEGEPPATVKVDRILCQEEEKLAGNRMLVYRCQSRIDGVEMLYELKYEVATCKWYLYKM